MNTNGLGHPVTLLLLNSVVIINLTAILVCHPTRSPVFSTTLLTKRTYLLSQTTMQLLLAY